MSWCARSSATILPGSIARSCWRMRSPRSTPDPRRCTISKQPLPAFSIASASAAARFSPACSGRASTASCSQRPRPTICIIPAMTGSRPCCAARFRVPWRGRKIPARRSTWWRSPPCARRARRRSRMAATNCPRCWERQRPARARAASSSTATRRSRPSRATCPPIPRRCSTARQRFAGCRPRQPRKAISVSSASARRRLEREGDEPTLPHIRLDRALQFLIGDKLS